MKLTQIDTIICTIAQAQGCIKLKDKEVTTIDSITDIILFAKRCLSIDHKNKTITIDCTTPTTRKSIRLINSLLQTFTKKKIKTTNKEWYIHENVPKPEMTKIDNSTITVNWDTK